MLDLKSVANVNEKIEEYSARYKRNRIRSLLKR